MSDSTTRNEGFNGAHRRVRFVDKVALVTGPSDRGIGAAIAERLADEGARLVLLGIHQPPKLCRWLARRQVEHLWQQADLTDRCQVDAAVEAAVERFGRLDVIVNNAGIGALRPIEQLTDDHWRKVYDVNVTGTARVIRAALPHLTSPGGVIVNVSSAMALTGCAAYSLYGSSKAAVVSMTNSLAWELAPRKIRAVGVAPAMIPTPMMMPAAEHLDAAARKQLEDCHPLGMGTPHDVASAVAFLASDEARWITGVTLPLGWCSRQPLPVEVLFEETGCDEPAAAEQRTGLQ